VSFGIDSGVVSETNG